MRFQEELKRNVTAIDDIKKYTYISPEEEHKLRRVVQRHPMSISRYYLSLIDWNDPDDPIRKMALPHSSELNIAGSYDTSGERRNTKLPGLQHKYPQTVLLLSTNRCAMYCRYCFRKRFVGLSQDEILAQFRDGIQYIKQHSEITNVLISGGDPFVLPTRVIGKFLYHLSSIPHLSFIRFGTRTPVTFPFRIHDDKKLLSLLREHSRPDRRIAVVTQFNHPREITPESTKAIDALLDAGVTVNNQTVLLKDVNDSAETIAQLMDLLVSRGVAPYYVFQCRPVKRVKHHFQVPLLRGLHIVEDAKRQLNGHAKRFKYIMAHDRGKIEILGTMDDIMYFKFHQARNPNNLGRMFRRTATKTAGWLDELERIPGE